MGEPFAGGKGLRLRLSPVGGREAIRLWNSLSKETRNDLYRIKSQTAPKGLNELLVYVYRTYPEFTTNSLIRDELLSEPLDD